MNRFLHLLFGVSFMAIVCGPQAQAQILKPDTNILPGVTVCKAALPYVYAGRNYFTPGIHEQHFVGSKGQDSLCVFALNIANNPTKTVRIGACRNVLATTGVKYNGKTYYSTGAYVDTVAGGTNCDTIVTVMVDSYTTYSDTVRLEFCQGATYKGVALTTPGTSLFSTDKLKTKTCQCDSVITTYVTVYPKFYKHDSITVCENSLPYNWRGIKKFYQSKDDTVKMYTTHGCDSIFTIRFTVTPAPATSDRVVVCPDVLKAGYSYGNKTFYHAEIDNVVFKAVNGCDSTVTLTIFEGKDYHIYIDKEVCPSDLPYYYMTETGIDSMSSTGRDTAFFTSVHGCDSIIYLTLRVNNDKTANVTAKICDDELPFRFAGKDIMAAGEYKFVYPTLKGCDSILTLNLTVNQTYITDTAITVCSDMVPFYFYGDTLERSGNYTYPLKTQAGCDSTLRLHFTVNATSMVSDEVTVCENEFPYTYAGKSFPSEGYYTINLKNRFGCDSIIALHINKRVIPSTPVQIYGEDKIGKAGVYVFHIDQVDHFYPITQYQWTIPDGMRIISQNREGDSIWVEISDNIGLSDGDITVYAYNECGQSDVCIKHIKTFILCGVRVYPNPVIRNGEVTIEFNDLIGKNKLRITDVTGRILHQEELTITKNHQEIRIYLGNFASGDYFIRIQTKDMAILKKLVVLKEENSSK